MLPYPLLTVSLTVMWLLLNGFTPGHFVFGILVAIFASWAMASLRPDKPKLRKWYLLPKLFGIVLYDIVKSNIAVSLIILKSRRPRHNPGFLSIPLDTENHMAIALLAIVITSTPGSAWLEYDSNDRTVLLHVLDIHNEAEWRDTVKNRYEKLLMEIFA